VSPSTNRLGPDGVWKSRNTQIIDGSLVTSNLSSRLASSRFPLWVALYVPTM
jgi:hypothetical protein